MVFAVEVVSESEDTVFWPMKLKRARSWLERWLSGCEDCWHVREHLRRRPGTSTQPCRRERETVVQG